MSVQSAIDALRPQSRGHILAPADEGYEAARMVYNGMIDKRPGAIARCTSVADLMAAVRVAREHDLLTAIRGSGTMPAALGSVMAAWSSTCPDAGCARGSGGAHGQSRGRVHGRRCGPRDACLRDGHADRDDRDHGYRRPGAWRGDRPSQPSVWSITCLLSMWCSRTEASSVQEQGMRSRIGPKYTSMRCIPIRRAGPTSTS